MADAGKYKKHTHREHILELPDTYIGSVDKVRQARWVINAESTAMDFEEVDFVPGLYKIFDEILVNALDQRVRAADKPTGSVKRLDITITPTRITVKNDGDSIPVVKHPDTGVLVPELIFGHLLTSSNYDKGEEKIVGGKNGYGAKLTNIYSSEFTLELVSGAPAQKYVQVWRDNMSKCEPPKITKSIKTEQYTSISFVPDLKRFNWMSDNLDAPTAIPTDMIRVLRTRAVDAAAMCGDSCAVYLNGTKLKINKFKKYVELFLNGAATNASDNKSILSGGNGDDSATVSTGTTATGRKPRVATAVAYEQAGPRWEVAAVLSRSLHGDVVPDDRHVSFVNGIATRRGGKHVEAVAKSVLTAFCALAKKKAKIDVTPAQLKDSVVWFINATIVNPSFDTQTKETLTTPPSKFGSTPEISEKFAEQLYKIGLLDEAKAILDAKHLREAKKTDGKKRSVLRGIPNLDDALWAGSAKSDQCTLILTEGNSAATTAISGLKIVGRERFGVFPLRGKLLNVKDISTEKKNANKELEHIKQILGLVSKKKYKSVKELRYGRVMIMTDQDVDGSHIKGLLINLFHTEWPELLHVIDNNNGFICSLMTPLLKASRGANILNFYSQSEYDQWRLAQPVTEIDKWRIKYYKGLGTSTAAEAREYFEHMHTVNFQWDDQSDATIDLAFNKKRSDDRKKWLSTYDKDRVLEVTKDGADVSYSRFVHDELIHFSNADNIRSLPNIMDGLKPSQRKILWSCIKRNLNQEIRVAQLAGYISEHANYHHGEVSLMGAIIGLAQDFVGSNNINVLSPIGQFGSRLMGGSDAASPRYIHTCIEPILREMIRKEDEPTLNYIDEDGDLIEPETYYPVVPLLLVNGSLGIGTGFSTEVLPHHPQHLVAAIRKRLHGEIAEMRDMEFQPWWFGFRGSVSRTADGKGWITKGLYDFVDDETHQIRIKELPVGLWTKDYKQFLEEMLAGECPKVDSLGGKATLRSFEEEYNDVDVDCLLTLTEDAYYTARAFPAEFETRFRLNNSWKETNMVAFNTEGHIHRYENCGEILDEFYEKRLEVYEKRREYQLADLADKSEELNAKMTFVKAVIDGTLKIQNASDEVLLKGLTNLKLPPRSDRLKPETLDAFDYLLRMRVDRLKAAAVITLQKELDQVLLTLQLLGEQTAESIWLKDLEQFEAAWIQYATARTGRYKTSGETSKVVAGAKRRVKKTK